MRTKDRDLKMGRTVLLHLYKVSLDLGFLNTKQVFGSPKAIKFYVFIST